MTDKRIVLGLPAGAEIEIDRDTVAGIEPLKTSLMPEGLGDALSAEQLEDLLTFLLTRPLEPAPITRTDPPRPPARNREQLLQVLGSESHPAVQPGPQSELRILLVAGPKDHGPDEHDYPLWLDRWSRLLALGDNVTVETSLGFPDSEKLDAADVAVFYNANPEWNLREAEMLDDYHQRGGGAVYIHYAVAGGSQPAAAADRMGLAFAAGSRFRHGAFDLEFTGPDHPITRGFPTLHFTDETYWKMHGNTSRLNVLATAKEEGEPRPQLWTLERHQSRIVGCIPGHYTWTFDDPLFRLLLLRAICWTANQPVDRLAGLSLIGARITR